MPIQTYSDRGRALAEILFLTARFFDGRTFADSLDTLIPKLTLEEITDAIDWLRNLTRIEARTELRALMTLIANQLDRERTEIWTGDPDQ